MPTERTLVTAVLLFLSISLAAWTAPASAAEPGARIIHKPDAYYFPGFRIEVQAEVRAAQGVTDARCYFRAKGQGYFHFVDMGRVQESLYYGVLPAPRLDTKGIEYYFSALDDRGVAVRSPRFLIREAETDEASEWRAMKDQLKDEARDELENRLMKRLLDRVRSSLPKWQTPKAEGSLLVRSEAAQTPKEISGFKDTVAVKGTEAAGASSAMAGAGIGTTTVVVGAVAIGAGAIALGGGGGGGSAGTSGPCAVHAGYWAGTTSGTNCKGETLSGEGAAWSITINDDCSTTSKNPNRTGNVSGNSITIFIYGTNCGTITETGTIIGNTMSGTSSGSAGGSASWWATKQ